MFDKEEKADLKRFHYPSARGETWREYIAHRLRMSENGIASYTKRYYARLKFSKYIDVTTAMDNMAMKIIPKGKRGVVYMGNANEAPANSPIKIKKFIRAPTARRLLKCFQKRPDNVTILEVDEYFTSQTCAKCLGRFERRTKSFKFKVCRDCTYSTELHEMTLVPTAVATVSRGIRRPIIHEMTENRIQNPKTVVWQRDITAAKCILIKGICFILLMWQYQYL